MPEHINREFEIPSSRKIKLGDYKMNKKVKMITQAAMIAALYVVLTYVANMFGLASGEIQLRFSESLTILSFFTPAAIPGLFIGCLLANWLTGCVIIDIIFGSLATLLGAIGTYLISKMTFKHKKWMASIPPILANTIIVPFVILYCYSNGEITGSAVPWLFFTVFLGELLSAGVLGTILLLALEKQKHRIFD